MSNTNSNPGASLGMSPMALIPSKRIYKKAKLSRCACGNNTFNKDKVCAVCRVFQRTRSNMPPEMVRAFGMGHRMELYGVEA